MTYLHCQKCGRDFGEEERRWRCECGSFLDLFHPFALSRASLPRRPPSLWRYREALPLSPLTREVSLGEPITPLIPLDFRFSSHLFKVDFLYPSGSFKDRGSAVLVSKVRELGISQVVEDSSGNAGASLAAYCAAAAIRCRIFVPASASEAKLAQIRAYGAELVKVEGPREEAARRAQEAAEEAYYASHSWNPYFLHGTKTIAFELWEQLGGRAPDLLVLPVGNGTLLLGAYLGFSQLQQAGEIHRLPRLLAVQAEGCAPLASAFARGQADPLPVCPTSTIAEGIAVARPVRGRQILEAVRITGGCFLTVSDQEMIASLRSWAAKGLYLEPTSAAVLCAWEKIREREELAGQTVVLPLTGSGLKSDPAWHRLS